MTESKPITLELSTVYEGGQWRVSGAFTVTSAKGAEALLRTLEIAREFLAENSGDPAPDQRADEIGNLRRALRPFALYADQNDLKERDPRGAIEVPIHDLVFALAAFGPDVHADGVSEDGK